MYNKLPSNKLTGKKLFLFFILLVISFILLLVLLQLGPLFSYLADLLKITLLPLFLAYLLAYLLLPLVKKIQLRGVPKTVAILLLYLTFFLTVILVILQTVPLILQQLNELVQALPSLFKEYEQLIAHWDEQIYFLPIGIQMELFSRLERFEESIADGLTGIVGQAGILLEGAVILFLIPILVFYMIKDRRDLKKFVLICVPFRKQKSFIRIAKEIDLALGRYIRGQLLVSSLLGSVAFISYWFLGLPYPLLLATCIAFTNIIPFIGPIIGAIPAILIALTISWKITLIVVAINVVLQIIEGNILSPSIIGRQIHIHPLIIILALLIGGKVGGILGLMLTIPICIVLKILFSQRSRWVNG